MAPAPESQVTLHSRLVAGIPAADRGGRPVLYRYLAPSDDLDRLTAMLHAAYAPLAEAGMRFVASHQDVDTTRRRLAKGEAIVAASDGEVIGTVTLASVDRTGGSPFYDRPDVMSVGQFAVLPARQRQGIGATLMDLAEALAREHGAAFVALDTSERALGLIAMYQARQYRFVEHVEWGGVNYRSVVLARDLRG